MIYKLINVMSNSKIFIHIKKNLNVSSFSFHDIHVSYAWSQDEK